MIIKRLITALAIVFAAPAYADRAWDAAADFHSEPWSYGWRMPGTTGFAPMEPRPEGTCGGGKLGGLSCYSKWGQAVWPLPQIGINATGSTINYSTGLSHMIIPVATVNMRPDRDGGMPVLRWTAPADGDYTVIGSAQVIDHATNGVVLHVTGLEEKRLAARFGAARSFNIRRSLRAGESIDFAVEAIGYYFSASTELRVSVLKAD